MENNNQNSDTTEQEQTIGKLRDSEKRYREILDNLDQGYYEVDLKGKYTFANKFQANFLGLSKEELIGTNYGLFYDKEREKRVFEKYNEVYKKNLPKSLIEVETIGPNGIKLTFEASINLKYDSNGKKIGFYGTVYDISERKKLELELAALNKELEQKVNIRTKKLRESEENWRSLAENAPNIITIVDREGNIQFLNRGATEIDVKEVFGSKIYEYIQPEYHDIVKRTIKRVLDTGESGSYEVKAITQQGRILWFETQVGPISQGEKIVNVLMISTDITERKQAEQKLKESEERYRSLFENMNAGFAYHKVITNDNNKPIDYKYLEVNPAFEKFTGLNAGDMIGKNVTEILPGTENDPADWIGKFGNVGLTGIPLTVEDYSDAIDKWFKVSGYSPKKGFFAVTFTDITERKKTEEKLKESERKFREAYNRAEFYKDLFAHDISNILQHILSATELSDILINNPENLKDIQANLNIIKDQVNRGAKLVSNVRKLSQLEEYKKSIKPLEIMNIIENTLTFIKDSYQEREIDIQVDSISNEVYIQANDLIQDVFENILINSVKHNNNPKVEIIVRFSREVIEQNHYLKIEFIDNGEGIEDARKETIFQRAYNEDISVSGMGLGLSLVKKIIDSFNGKIWVEDKVKDDYSKGSNFTILLQDER